MSLPKRPQVDWQLRTRSLPLGQTTAVMGIVNVTPDSFSEGGAGSEGTAGYRATDTAERAIERGLLLLEEGATLLDLGGESTRPGSHAASAAAISDAQEQDRVLPVLDGILREQPDALLSIDTYRAGTARAAVAAGCEIVNDVSGLLWDQAMASTCAELGCGLVLMHTRGRPDEWRSMPPLPPAEVAPLVLVELRERLAAACRAGIARERIVLDPGYGFGKAFDANYALLAAQALLLELGRPLLAGVSRKSFLGRTLARRGVDRSPRERETASVAAMVLAVAQGAAIVRVHEVRPAVEAASIADAVLRAG